MIDKKKCYSYGKGGYCCIAKRNYKCKSRCNEFVMCKWRLRCHVRPNSNNKCINFKLK